MRIRSQFVISITAFFIVLVIIAASLAITEQQNTQLDSQQTAISNLETGASNLNYISNSYFLYQDNSSIILWQSEYSRLANYVSKVTLSDPEQKALLQAVKSDLDNLKTVFDGVVLFLQSSPRNLSVRALPEFQTQWSRMAVQIQALSFDSQQLSRALTNQSNQLTLTTIVLIVALLGLFGAYFITNYLLASRKTLDSISKLQSGIAVIGSGDLDYLVKAGRNDEIEQISNSVNQMAVNLKTVTASKTELEKEITERKKVELALKESEALYRTLFDNSEDAFMLLEPMFDKEGNAFDISYLKLNKAYEQQTGAKAADILGKTSSKATPQLNPEVISYSGEVTKTGKSFHVEIGDKFSGKFYDSFYFPYAKGQVGILFRDITERKNLEGQLKERERLAAIGATAGMVGHDIRNPLQAMVGEVYLLKTDLERMPESETKESVKESFESMEKNIGYINKIVADLQDYARPLNPEYSDVNLEEVIVSVFETILVPDTIKLSFDIKTGPMLRTDPTFIRRVLTNLVNNAVQAMPDSGKLELAAFKDNEYVCITVSDTGKGIPKEIEDRIFTPMVTSKAQGQGFGLAVSKRMIEALKGTISFESEVGKGTKFIIQLPINS